MVRSMTVFLFAQLLGEAVAGLGHWPVPGPVIGLALLLAVLAVRKDWIAPLTPGADHLHRHMPLFFVPAGAGIMTQAGLLTAEWWPIVATLIGSTLIGLAVTARATDWAMQRWPEAADT
jgi:putative effector of murein hydrolase LrgA (UPF0299 family)